MQRHLGESEKMMRRAEACADSKRAGGRGFAWWTDHMTIEDQETLPLRCVISTCDTEGAFNGWNS